MGPDARLAALGGRGGRIKVIRAGAARAQGPDEHGPALQRQPSILHDGGTSAHAACTVFVPVVEALPAAPKEGVRDAVDVAAGVE